ncbi:AraC family transcriptional regulator [Verrucomicrobium sp. BvORR034]|uniref:AraC family transcriptional regulator n=1 Tax=Verrucomicrobium sp. BvORR034 TaxID=1396418 RepID=UPI0006795453|nr:AraC family transcriptional regulator [Verrucomicrobium sp. BvORR034]
MSKTHQDLSETHILGEATTQKVVRVDVRDRREWLAKAPACSALAQHRIAHLGICEAQSPYNIVRMKQSGTYFMACYGGEGRILVDGRWQRCRAGMACLLPPHLLNAFHAVPSKPWNFVWVRYQAVPEQRPLVSASSPVLAKFDPEPLRLAMLGLHAECVRSQAESTGDKVPSSAPPTPAPVAMHHWVELVQTYVLRFAQPWQMDDRLSRLWEKIAHRLGEPWTLSQLAQEVHMSEEHLRRLTTQQLGRSPMRQLTYLRMRHAAELLSSTEDKIESIALAVGYHNAFVFSTTFKKWTGWRPSEHRARTHRA